MTGRARVTAGLPVVWFLCAASTGSAQMARLSTTPPIAEVRQGDALLGFGISYGFDQTFPLSGLKGDLLSIGRFVAAYGIADHAVLQLEWDALRILRIEQAGPSAVMLAAGSGEGHTSDLADARITLTYAPFSLRSGVLFGGWAAFELPNSEQSRGIGNNTSNALVGGLVSIPREHLTLTGRLGLGILESPLRQFSQDDVVVYGVDGLVDVTDRLRLTVSVDGRTNPRRTVSLGAEDVGAIRAGAEIQVGGWRIDGGLASGFAHRSPAWQVDLGLSWIRRAD
ncbi:MAG: hypothetical protein OEM96_04400 [Gemmatimonadota bacterium]|nr:hypothetical protein [Gemmatimonadota bacterium]